MRERRKNTNEGEREERDRNRGVKKSAVAGESKGSQ